MIDPDFIKNRFQHHHIENKNTLSPEVLNFCLNQPIKHFRDEFRGEKYFSLHLSYLKRDFHDLFIGYGISSSNMDDGKYISWFSTYANIRCFLDTLECYIEQRNFDELFPYVHKMWDKEEIIYFDELTTVQRYVLKEIFWETMSTIKIARINNKRGLFNSYTKKELVDSIVSKIRNHRDVIEKHEKFLLLHFMGELFLYSNRLKYRYANHYLMTRKK